MKIHVISLMFLSSIAPSLTAAEMVPTRSVSLKPSEVEQLYDQAFTYPSEQDLVTIFVNLGANEGGQSSIDKNVEFIARHENKIATVGYALKHVPVSLVAGVTHADHMSGLDGAMNKREAYFTQLFNAALLAQLKRAGLLGAVVPS